MCEVQCNSKTKMKIHDLSLTRLIQYPASKTKICKKLTRTKIHNGRAPGLTSSVTNCLFNVKAAEKEPCETLKKGKLYGDSNHSQANTYPVAAMVTENFNFSCRSAFDVYAGKSRRLKHV